MLVYRIIFNQNQYNVNIVEINVFVVQSRQEVENDVRKKKVNLAC